MSDSMYVVVMQLCYDLSSHLRRLLDASSNSFWKTGWVYTRVLDHVAFACDGRFFVLCVSIFSFFSLIALYSKQKDVFLVLQARLF